MNQTFNIKRFGRYTRFTLSMNRWYYGALLLLCVVPAAVLSITRLGNFSRGLLYFSTILTLVMPSIDHIYVKGYKIRKTELSASWLEKLIVEIAVRHWTLVVPFAVHAVAVAFGANGLTAYFADGFKIQDILYLLTFTNLGLLSSLAVENSWVLKGFLRENGGEKISLFVWVFIAVDFGFLATVVDGVFCTFPIPIMLTIVIASFVATLIFYRKQKGC